MSGTTRIVKLEYDDSVIGPICRDLVRLRDTARWYYQPLIDKPADPASGIPAQYFPPGLWASAVGAPGRPWLYRFPFPHHPMEVLAAQRGYGGLENGPSADPSLLNQVFVAEDSLDRLKSIRQGSWNDRATEMGTCMFLTPAQSRFLMHLFTPVTELFQWFTVDGLNEVKARRRLYAAAGIDRPRTRAAGAQSDANYNTLKRKDLWDGLCGDGGTLTVRI